MSVIEVPMFDVDELCAGSGPRAGRNDPVQSHKAADRSQRTMHATNHLDEKVYQITAKGREALNSGKVMR